MIRTFKKLSSGMKVNIIYGNKKHSRFLLLKSRSGMKVNFHIGQ